MNQTTSFFLFTFIATLTIFSLIFFNRSIQTAQKMVRGFYLLCLFLSLATFVITLLLIFGVMSVSDNFLQTLIFRGWIVIGTAISSTVLMLLNSFGSFKSQVRSEAVRHFISSQYLLKGLCFSVAISFFAVEIGKFVYDAEMRKFFLESGYAVWFLYFITAVETLGAIGLFIPKLIVPAASGLAVIMFGAIYTHYRNNDPFSDSLEAFHLLVILVCIIIIRLFGRKEVTDGDAITV